MYVRSEHGTRADSFGFPMVGGDLTFTTVERNGVRKRLDFPLFRVFIGRHNPKPHGKGEIEPRDAAPAERHLQFTQIQPAGRIGRRKRPGSQQYAGGHTGNGQLQGGTEMVDKVPVIVTSQGGA